MLKRLSRMFKYKWFPFLMAYLSKYAVRVILWTCRVEVEGLDYFVRTATDKGCLLMLWHNRLAVVAEFFHRHAPQFIYAAFISKSRDGELLAIVARSYKAGRAIRVSHNAKHQALKTVIDNLKTKRDVILMTPDGPRGPCYKVKPGIVLAARETDAAIVPFTWTAKRFWSLKTWDKLMLPKPFTTLFVKIGAPIQLQPHHTDEEAAEDLENALNRL